MYHKLPFELKLHIIDYLPIMTSIKLLFGLDIEILSNSFNGRCISYQIWAKAIFSGNLEVCKYLDKRGFVPEDGAGLADGAASRGFLDLFVWLVDVKGLACSANAMDSAASNGHLEMVRYLDQNKIVGCSTAAIDSAARNGHLKVVEYLFENRNEGCTSNALSWAKNYGRLDVLAYLNRKLAKRVVRNSTVLEIVDATNDAAPSLVDTCSNDINGNVGNSRVSRETRPVDSDSKNSKKRKFVNYVSYYSKDLNFLVENRLKEYANERSFDLKAYLEHLQSRYDCFEERCFDCNKKLALVENQRKKRGLKNYTEVGLKFDGIVNRSYTGCAEGNSEYCQAVFKVYNWLDYQKKILDQQRA